MAANNGFVYSAYSIQQPLATVFPRPVVANRAPAATDINYPLGQVWVVRGVNAAYILTTVLAGVATWLSIAGGGAGVFTSLTVNPGPTSLSTVGSGAVTIGNAANAGAVTISVGTGNFAINGNGNLIGIGTDAAANVITIGNSTGVTQVNLNAGTAGVTVGTNAVAHTVSIGNNTGASIVAINGGTGGAGGINIATTANDVPVVIGNSTGASAITLNAGTGGVNVGTNAIAHTIVIGNGTGASAVVVNNGTGASSFAANATDHSTTVGSVTGVSATVVQGGTSGITLTAPFVALPGPVYIYTGAGAPAGGLALHVGDLYINTTAASAVTRMYCCDAPGSWVNFTMSA